MVLVMKPLNIIGVLSLKQSLRRSLRQHQWDSNTRCRDSKRFWIGVSFRKGYWSKILLSDNPYCKKYYQIENPPISFGNLSEMSLWPPKISCFWNIIMAGLIQTYFWNVILAILNFKYFKELQKSSNFTKKTSIHNTL